jgi:hypothetical protein
MPNASLPEPPRVPVLGQPPPVIEPPLVDLPPHEGLDVEDVETLDIEVSEGQIDAGFVRTAHEVAFRDERVRELLAERRYVIVGARAVDDKQQREASFLLVLYRYDDAATCEVYLSGEPDRLEIVDVRQVDYQPPPADEEIEEAIRIARADERVGRSLEDAFEAHALLVSDVEQGDEHHGHRRFSVVFGQAEERLPRVHVIVDLISQGVIDVKMGAL